MYSFKLADVTGDSLPEQMEKKDLRATFKNTYFVFFFEIKKHSISLVIVLNA